LDLCPVFWTYVVDFPVEEESVNVPVLAEEERERLCPNRSIHDQVAARRYAKEMVD
jgi:hypothetical protein